MRIQHNIMAMNAYRNYNTNTSALSKNLEKLSSGYKINRAGDDAAGLAISEKMRAQITGLNAAQKNVKDGISLVKTAEGAMQEIQDMLNRMDYLATQSANGTYDDPVDRLNLQKEVKALKTEINRIADSANFNGIKLLDGSLGEGSSTTVVKGLKDVTLSNKTDGQVAGLEAQAGKWELDLSKFTFNAKDTAGSQFTIKVGNTVVATVTLSVTGQDTTIADAEVAVTSGVLSSGAASINVSFEDGKIILEMENTPTTNGTTAGAANTTGTGMPDLSGTNFQVTFGGGATSTNINKMAGATSARDTLNNLKMDMTTIQAAREPGAERKFANATFTLSADQIKDGNVLKIGDETYTFAVGAKSEFKGGKNVINLTDMEDADIGAKLTAGTIYQRISEAAQGNKQFYVGAHDTNGITLVEKEDSGLDYVGSPTVGKKNDVGNDADWKGVVQIGKGTVSTSGDGGGLRLQIGDTADTFNQMSVIVGDMHVNAMGKGKTTLDGKEIEVTKTVDDVDISNQDGAAEAIGIIKNAINYVSGIRGDLGAVQNRLDHTAKNLSVMAENIQDAESTIRDTDVAEEMMAYTKNNILIQSAQAMLAQANAVPQGVLQLLG